MCVCVCVYSVVDPKAKIVGWRGDILLGCSEDSGVGGRVLHAVWEEDTGLEHGEGGEGPEHETISTIEHLH